MCCREVVNSNVCQRALCFKLELGTRAEVQPSFKPLTNQRLVSRVRQVPTDLWSSTFAFHGRLSFSRCLILTSNTASGCEDVCGTLRTARLRRGNKARAMIASRSPDGGGLAASCIGAADFRVFETSVLRFVSVVSGDYSNLVSSHSLLRRPRSRISSFLSSYCTNTSPIARTYRTSFSPAPG